jgi:transcriptional regulator with XRE-family HTH domain
MAILISGAQIRMARGLLKWSVVELSQAANVGTTTIKRLELVDGSTNANIATVQAVHNAFVDTGKIRFEGEEGVFIVGGELLSKEFKT